MDFLYSIFDRKKNSIFKQGDLCEVVLLDSNDLTRGDVVHPCVRYIPEGFRGHRWWMVYTPYYDFNNKIENPRLCYGLEEKGKETTAPRKWIMAEEVEIGKEVGYNSDPTMIYHDKSLYIYWRENFTTRTISNGDKRATFCKVYKEDRIENVIEPILSEKTVFSDKEMCPTFLTYNNIFYAYGVDYRFFSVKLSKNRLVNKILSFTGKLNIYSQAKSNGIALWTGDTLTSEFHYIGTFPIMNINKLHKPWHMDFFECEDKIYAVILTNAGRGDLCLAESSDGRNFRMFNKPLLTNKTLGCIEIYKSTAVVVDNTFYLYYTVRNVDHPKLNQLYISSIPFVELKKELES